MTPHSVNQQTLLAELGVNGDLGLTNEQVLERRAKFGENKLQEKKKKTTLQRFFEQFKDAMIIILLIAAAVSLGIAIYNTVANNHFDLVEMIEPFLILAIVIINAVMGVVQESKAEKALDALKNMSAPHARVIRDGVEKIIMSSELVPGDIIKLEAGDFVPADARLLKSVNLKSEESALTGESVPSEKFADAEVKEKAPIGDRTNMVFSGCSITYGTAIAVVTATGMQTEMGKIAGILANEEENKTPLQEKLAKLGSMLGILILGICFVMFLVQLVRDGFGFDNIINGFMSAISLAVSAIPEGLPAVVTIVLSIGVQRMVKKNAIIRRLPAVETLGSSSIICSDKTGTLTMNRMTLVKAYFDGEEQLEQISENCSDKIKKLLSYGTLCCDGSVVFDNGKETHIGDPTETAIVLASHKNGNTKEQLNKDYPRIAELPFDSDRKLMSTVNLIDGKKIVIVKGAVDVMEKRCVKGDFVKAKQMNEEMSYSALRVLAVAYKEIDELPEKLTTETLENGLTFMGLVGMIDPPRPEAKEAVKVCRQAGIKPVMITGDHVATASAIAKELGILLDGDKAITGADLDAMSDEELDREVENISVYARVSPENKIRIVKAWQKKGQVVSMTGDGVNDAPALKAADIGCAMGITGTDVAKGAADMTLTDDNFATIVDAVKEGRGIFENIKKVVGFLLSTNLAEVLVVFISTVILGYVSGLGNPFIPIQLLWINLVTDSLPAIALGMEAVENDVMFRKPNPKNESLFARGLGVKIVFNGILLTLTTLAGYVIGAVAMQENGALNHDAGSTMAFMILAMSQLVQALNMRSSHSLFKVGFFTNKTMNLSLIVCTALTAVVLLIPGVNAIFGMMFVDWWLYLVGLGLSLLPIAFMEISKALGIIKHHHDAR
ncbi:MAG: calcium-translocating P-type ATPase, PMCA-type [Clostridiales bacterium]|nr:calcium-translocating P-type ATPase, PMCA-type [Clostridiales bacterium]